MGVQLKVRGHVMHLDFHVMNLSKADVVLDYEWLHGLGMPLKCSSTQHVYFLCSWCICFVDGRVRYPCFSNDLLCTASFSNIQKRNKNSCFM